MTTTFRYTVMEGGQPVQKEIYDGECEVVYLKPGGELDSDFTGIRREPTFWQNDISYTFEKTNRMSIDRPTVTIAIPHERLGIESLTPAAADFCLRTIKPYFDAINAAYANKARPDKDNGKFYVYAPGGEVLLRNAAYFAMRPGKDYENDHGATITYCKYTAPPPERMCLCIRIEVQLPHGKVKRAIKMLTKDLPVATEGFIRGFNHTALLAAITLEEQQNMIRRYLRKHGYCAFIANGSILPRKKGTQLPMENALPFQSTPEDEITIAGIPGMGIKCGVTVITGGGYSGKSTVLNAISAGIYNHAAGDGRELCITDERAVTITAEDGRAVSCLNISPFIKWVPDGDTHQFSTAHASGSTSQAANIIEAIDCGATLLLIDEDRSATNFMIRDKFMKELIKKEPITPFTDRVRELSANGTSTILVIGGSGEYLSVADKIYMMDEFVICDATARAKRIAPEESQPPVTADWTIHRVMCGDRFTSYPQDSGTEKLEVSDTGFILCGDERIDIRALHDIATAAQVDALAFMLRFLQNTSAEKNELEILARTMRGLAYTASDCEIDISAKIDQLYEHLLRNGFDRIDTGFFVTMNRFLDLPRKIELHAAIHRMRHVIWHVK
jgi:predicted ABC-class ATPase